MKGPLMIIFPKSLKENNMSYLNNSEMFKEIDDAEPDDLGFSRNDYDSPDFDPLAELIKRNKGINPLRPLVPPEWPANYRESEIPPKPKGPPNLSLPY